MFLGKMRGRQHIKRSAWSLILLAVIMALVVSMTGCGKESTESAADQPEASAQPESFDIAVFIPGVTAGSPLYQMLADGVSRAADEYDYAAVKVVEGGFNQAEWQDKVTELAATKKYEVIISSNPALPEICSRVGQSFPDQKFVLFDGHMEGNDSIYTFRYNQYEQAFLAGHMAGLVTTGGMPGTNPEAKIGLIAGQEYPDMNRAIGPGFLAGARMVDDKASLDFRVVGNWYDATKAAELAQSMINGGVDVVLPIAGGANQGAIKTAEENGIYLHWFDTNGYALAPGRVIGSTALLQEKAAYEITVKAIEGRIPFGEADVVGVADGWVTFLTDDPRYIDTVPEELRARQAELLDKMKRGEISFEMP